MTRILAIGDVVGKAGRRCLAEKLPVARERFGPDFVIVNAENAAGGFGLTWKIYRELVEKHQIDCLTMGNHWHDKREIYSFAEKADRMLLPANMSNVDSETKGLKILTAADGTRVAVVNLIGRAFMHSDNRCPFKAVDKLLAQAGETVKVRVIDMHAEATSEKQGMGHYLSGRASLVYGTHCHVPTADDRIIEGTGFVTDIGMTGAFDSVIGIRKQSALARLLTGEKKRFEPATGDPWLCGVLADIDPDTGQCQNLEPLRWRPGDPQ